MDAAVGGSWRKKVAKRAVVAQLLAMGAFAWFGLGAAPSQAAVSNVSSDSGQVFDWGNDVGDTPQAVAVAGPTEIDGENGFALAVVNGQVFEWGQLGAARLQRKRQIQQADLTNVVDVQGGDKFALAVEADGTVWGWGANGDGQLCLGDTLNRSQPTQIPGIADAVAVTGGASHSLILLSTGEVLACGMNNEGQLGSGTVGGRSDLPVAVTGIDNAVTVTAGNLTSGAILATGQAVEWGENNFGQLGDGTTANADAPQPVVGLSNVVQLSNGGSERTNGHALALTASGAVYAWGDNAHGQLGQDDQVSSDVPLVVPVEATEVSAGGAYSMVLTTSGTVDTWGAGSGGELGDGSTLDSLAPTAIGSSWAMISAGAGVGVAA